MTSKQPPRLATWLLKNLGSGPNQDAVLGDLAERYEQKDSALWYWRQALKAIPVSFVTEIRGNRIPVLRAFGIVFLALVLIAFLLSDFDPYWKIWLVPILGGVVIGVVMYWRGDRQTEPVELNRLGDLRIDSSKIPIRGGIGAGILILILLSGVLVELPQLRLVAVISILAGIVFGGVLILWHRHQAGGGR